jgi:hypothetical protein
MHIRRSSDLARIRRLAVSRALALFAVLGFFVLNVGVSTAAAGKLHFRAFSLSPGPAL